ncbi:MAG: hypothetical protein OXH96_01505 [Spirochaetaceae bacterium]|nr:hypothetical protein [Spirochaetaceae bacterium]
MSEGDQPERALRHYIQDIIEFGTRIVSYTDGLSQTQFVADTLIYDATLPGTATTQGVGRQGVLIHGGEELR